MTDVCAPVRASILLDMSLQCAAWHAEWAELVLTLPHPDAFACSCTELAAARVHAQLAHSRATDTIIDVRTDDAVATISL